MNKIKRTLALALSLVMASAVLASCGKNDKDSKKTTTLNTQLIDTENDSQKIDYDKLVIPEKKLVIDGEEVDTSELVVMTINDEYEVTFDEYRFFYFYAMNYTGVDFSALEDDKKAETYELLKTYVEDSIKGFYADFIIAEKNGVVIDETVEKEVEDYYQEVVAEHENEENFKKLLMSEYNYPEMYKKILLNQNLYEKINEILYGENGTNYVTEDEFREIAKSEEFARVKHILITFASMAELSDEDMEGYDELTLSEKLQLKEAAYAELDEETKKTVDAKAKTEIESVLEKVNAGEDFDKLIKEYGWDPGMEQMPDGYCITERTSFVEEFITASFKLKAGETSGVVESDYGYHILKREAVDDEFIDANMETLYNDYCGELYSYIDTEMRGEIVKGMKITYCDEYAKFSADSIS